MNAAPAPSPLRFQWRIEGRVAEIAQALEAFEHWAAAVSVSHRSIVHCRLMLDELITNVVTHGYAAGEPQGVELEADRLPQAVRMVLTDYAFPYDPLQAPPPDLTSDLEERDIGGLGVHFVRELADELDYERVQVAGRGANRLRIVKQLG